MPKKFPLEGRSPYPHIEITREAYPRFLATRSLDDKGVDYFGAFLTKTAVRILIDFLNRTFRLRSCDLEIDGTFPVPCTQYFKKRCLAPCVNTICSKAEHADAAGALSLFLRNERADFKTYISDKIERYSAGLEFEKAAFWRDMLKKVEELWQDPRLNVWLNDAVDTYQVDETEGCTNVFLVTSRGRYALGKHIFVTEDSNTVLADLMDQFYQYHLPREIRVGTDFAGGIELKARLSKRFGREANIVIIKPGAVTRTARRAFERTKTDADLESVKERFGKNDVRPGLQKLSGLNPATIEAIDVSHISGMGMVGAASVWRNGAFFRNQYGFALFDSAEGEVSAMSAFIYERYRDRPIPDLILVDGGKPQLNAAVDAIKSLSKQTAFLAAVKPAGKHSQISHFMTRSGDRIEFDAADASHLFLQRLRDDAHELANYVHGEFRDARHFYEATGTQPLVVPIRFTTSDGGADDLRPIVTKDRPTHSKDQRRSNPRVLYRPLKRAL